MKYKVITTDEILRNNPRYCLSAQRVFNRCFECSEYEKKTKQKDGSYKIKICESRIINTEYDKKREQINKLKEQTAKIEQEIKDLS
ncbi:MAG TPA: hypothetical protein VGB37_16505 [Candidatus Lokiarchaeia archaeon]